MKTNGKTIYKEVAKSLVALTFLEAIRNQANKIKIVDNQKEIILSFLINEKWHECEPMPNYLKKFVFERIVKMAKMKKNDVHGIFEMTSMGAPFQFEFNFLSENELNIEIYGEKI